MRKRHAVAGAAALLFGCSPAPVAYRGRADHSATPPADDAGTGAVPTSSTVPAAPEPDPTTTTVVVTLPHAATSTTLAVLPERADVAVGDVEWLVRQTFPEDPNRAAAIAWRESRYDPGADTNPPYIGVMQIDSVLHRKLIASMGYTTADLYNAVINLAVARRLFDIAGWTPWA